MDVGAGGAGSSPTTRFCTIDPGMHGGKPRRHRDNSQSSIKFSSGFALRYCNELNTRSHIPAWPRKSAANATCDLQQSHDSRPMIHTSPPCPCRPGMPEPIIEPGALPRGLQKTCRAKDLHRCAGASVRANASPHRLRARLVRLSSPLATDGLCPPDDSSPEDRYLRPQDPRRHSGAPEASLEPRTAVGARACHVGVPGSRAPLRVPGMTGRGCIGPAAARR